ncbi:MULTISPECIES: hypothetical protein [Parabacteroides]|jgi:hypothetical protein|uniref:hypothetical protein n=1 Tax=Parabacteroides TaxID=375288 RepID=UPI0012F8DE71|nr:MULTISPECIES: hypothetical protein [Parabacteroides]MBV3301878.1 hypothetical protein [Parabacteroides distasonis]MCS3348039.1 hypothetical protein [Parabacteroides distasonis]MDB8988758.1 hypothetical protein [Parabacteroides distasonis]MDB9012367.1 hypothetical protein [Parabacteroides distasonis]MDB9033722.1 hypothetical protein [Parabacteroides distasonis]
MDKKFQLRLILFTAYSTTDESHLPSAWRILVSKTSLPSDFGNCLVLLPKFAFIFFRCQLFGGGYFSRNLGRFLACPQSNSQSLQ